MGTEPVKLREIAGTVEEIMRNDPNMRTVNVDWGERVPKLHDCNLSGFHRQMQRNSCSFS